MAALPQISIGSGRSSGWFSVAGKRAFRWRGAASAANWPGRRKDYFEAWVESLRDITAMQGSMFPQSAKSIDFGVVWPGFAPIC
jgi:hypothetical protein